MLFAEGANLAAPVKLEERPIMRNIIYIIGLIVVVLAIISFVL